MGTYLVTGHAGFIGSRLTRKLLESNHRVIGVDCITDYYSRDFKISNLEMLNNLNGNYTHLELDLNQIENFNFTLGKYGLSGIFHLAGQPGVRGSWSDAFAIYARNNIVATQRIFDFAGSTIPVVFASSSSVYGNATTYPVIEKTQLNPISPYGLTKKTCEELATIYNNEFGLQSTALRYFTVYGPGQRPDMAFTKLCSSLITGDQFSINGNGEQIRDFTFVEDAVSATINAMQGSRLPVYNVGGGHEISLNGVIKIFEEVSGKKLNAAYVGHQAGDVFKTGANTDLLNRTTSWEARVGISEGIRMQWDWAISNPHFFVKKN